MSATGRRAPGFLELLLSVNVCMRLCVFVYVCVCPPPRLFITSGVMGVMWTPYDWSNKFYGFYMAAVVDIDSRRGVSSIRVVETGAIRVS